MKTYIVGIDISNEKLDIYLDYNNKSFEIQNNYKSIYSFLNGVLEEFDSDTKDKLYIILEPTGVYGQDLIKVINDLNIQSFAIGLDVISKIGYALGDRNKNDVIDSKKDSFYLKNVTRVRRKQE